MYTGFVVISFSLLLVVIGMSDAFALDGDYYISNTDLDSNSGNIIRVTPGGDDSLVAQGYDFAGLDFDQHGNIIAADTSGRLLKVTTGGTVTVISAVGNLESPQDVIVDTNGDYIVVDGDKVIRITESGSQSIVASGGSNLKDLQGITLDVNGDYIVSDLFNEFLVRVKPNGNNSPVANSGLNIPWFGIDTVSSQTFVVTSSESNLPDGSQLSLCNPSCGVFSGGGFLNSAIDVEVDANGDFIVINNVNNNLVKVDKTTETQSLILSNNMLDNPRGIAIEPLSSADNVQVIGGEVIPIDSAALLLGGAQTSFVWILPAILAGAGWVAFNLRRK